MARFEAHITVDREHGREVEEIGGQIGWVYSQITGCPLLGQGTYCYLTNYNADIGELKKELDFAVTLLERRGITPLRAKIERIVYDTKTGVNELGSRPRAYRECDDMNCHLMREHAAHS